MQELPKRPRASRGRCALCFGEFGKAQVARHLEKHHAEQAATTGAHVKRFHLLVESRHSPEYWLHLDVRASAALNDLDSYLRGIWLECCGHLSAFEIDGVRYDVTVKDASEEDDEEEEDDFWSGLGLAFGGPLPKSMSARLSETLLPGTKFTHEYDFGSTTELKLRVVSEHEGIPGPDTVLLARNIPPAYVCEYCGEPAVWMGVDEEGEYRELCKKCAKRAKLDEWLLPIVNSPRAGVCGYEGSSRKYPV